MQMVLVNARIVGIEPRVWRHLLVPSSLSLADFHEVLQAAFEWDDQHAHLYRCEDEYYGVSALRDELGVEVADDAHVLLGTFDNDRLIYQYGPPDGWAVECTVNQALNLPNFPFAPYCIDGARGAPPEDAGGLNGYERLVRATESPELPESGPLLEWLGDWDPEELNVDEINDDLSEIFE